MSSFSDFRDISEMFCSIEVETQRAELYEQTEQLNRLQGRLQELAIEKKEATDVISKARPQHVLLTEVFKLRGVYSLFLQSYQVQYLCW